MTSPVTSDRDANNYVNSHYVLIIVEGVSCTGCPKMISATLKFRTPVFIEDMAYKYGSIRRKYGNIFTTQFFAMFVYFHFLYNLKAKMLKNLKKPNGVSTFLEPIFFDGEATCLVCGEVIYITVEFGTDKLLMK